MRARRAARLSRPDLDRPWRSVGYCVLDFETTGLDLRRDEVISYGLVHVDGGRMRVPSSRYAVVRPDRPVSVGALQVHNLRTADLDQAPPLEDVLDDLLAGLAGRVLVAHAAWVELAFLRRALGAGRRWLGPAVVDTAQLARAAGLVTGPAGYEPDLEDLAGRLGLCVHEPHHALGDALTTGEVFLALASILERRAHSGPALTARDLVRGQT